MMKSINPATGHPIGSYQTLQLAGISHHLSCASASYHHWRNTSLEQRSAALTNMATRLRDNTETYARLMTSEMGKPLTEARGEIAKCAWVCDHYAAAAPSLLSPRPVAAAARESYLRFDPIGPILAIMPWNFPFWQVFRFAAPALMAGNAIIIKHAPNVQGVAQAIETLAIDAGLPDGLFSNLRVEVPQIPAIIADRQIAAVTLTGSDRAGRSVARIAGESLKKVVLELGGSDPAIVLSDANLDTAIPLILKGRMLNGGQTCCAIKRVLIQRNIYPEFKTRFIDAVAKLKVGDPLNPQTDIGPLARPDLVDALEAQIARTLDSGASLLSGGHRIDGPGNFFQPTVIADAPVDSPACQEELFGPVVSLHTFDTLNEGINLANDSRFGLCASVWTEDRALAKQVAARLDVGGVFINNTPGSDPRLPFGGVKDSGFGRELGEHGLFEFVNVKTVCLD